MRKSYQLPGGIVFNTELSEKLDQRHQEYPADYRPRTHHLVSEKEPKYTNRLFLETSPYLLQHAHNPVNWYPWGDEAFEDARRLDRPVLVSIGYSTCHWCHVMEEESFEDEEIASVLNESYICIKVDREERPDVDAVYMSAIQLLTGGGGWPLNVWLTSDKKPFWGGTYFPARDGDRGAAHGFLSVLKNIAAIYSSDQKSVHDNSQVLENAIQKATAPEGGSMTPGQEFINDAIDHYKNNFDSANGGTIGAPKFPSNLPLRLLIRHHYRQKDPFCLTMAETTLKRLARGGIRDHIGGGFHRYSVDETWLVPHFEKMLYDNALLTFAYLDAFQVTQNPFYKDVVEDILQFVERDMKSPSGAFYSAIDADSLTPEGKREEGYYFTWPYIELEKILTHEELKIVEIVYGATPRGNFEGRNILFTPKSMDSAATELEIEVENLSASISVIRHKLLNIRNQRSLPITDTKILTSWNGLMISAFAKTGYILNNTHYLEIAEKAAKVIQSSMPDTTHLIHSVKINTKDKAAFLEDYAYFIAALLDLFETTWNGEWLELAIRLEQTMAAEFEDTINGAFFTTGSKQERLITREKPVYDGATPSGNSVAVENLLRLSDYTGEVQYFDRAGKAIKNLIGGPQSNPLAVSELLLSLDHYHDRPLEIAIVGDLANAAPFVSALRERYLPNKAVAVTTTESASEQLSKQVSFLEGKPFEAGKATAYICRKGACQEPSQTVDAFIEQLGGIKMK